MARIQASRVSVHYSTASVGRSKSTPAKMLGMTTDELNPVDGADAGDADEEPRDALGFL